ncbi:MAG: peptide transporter substrate-binding protein, partial [Ilumatobacteraceae bacterium]|nr:peptide transporter substrate-binding protein [Ilumatobacteraceae bacterium]
MEDMDQETGEGFIESTMSTRLSRRDLARRAAVVGISIPAVGAFISACGSDDKAETVTTDAASGGTDAAGGTTPPAAGTGGTIRVATEKPAGALDPVAMQDLGSYGIVAQSFEFLATLGTDDIAPGLATEWSSNADGSVWTFKLREGVKWQDPASGSLTSADVAATFDRLVAAGNSGLKGVIDVGSVDTTDPLTAVVTLISPNGNFPYLVSVYNAQSVITPAAYVAGTTLDGKPDGTGPWKLDKYDPNTGCSFVRNDAWWGGATPLDSTEFQFFTDLGTQVTAIQGGAVDAIVQFQVIGGDALLNDPDFEAIGFRAATHREIWMRCDTGQFAQKGVRQALALSLDRPALIETLFRGKADLGNDHVIAPIYPYFDPSVPQRVRDIAKAKELMAAAGFADGIDVTFHAGDLQEIPQ